MHPPAAGSPLQWGIFFALIAGMLALDLGVINRREHRVGVREALVWSVVWTAVGLAFNLWVNAHLGRQAGLEFLTGYVIERALSFDNIFVFVVLFNYFAVPAEQQHRVLFWGILGALASRGLFIALGTALISRFEGLTFVLGAFLVYTGVKIFRDEEPEVHPERNPVLRAFRRFVPLTANYRGKRFFAREDGRLKATPLLLVLVVLECTDVVFAVDSIPAVFGVTRNDGQVPLPRLRHRPGAGVRGRQDGGAPVDRGPHPSLPRHRHRGPGAGAPRLPPAPGPAGRGGRDPPGSDGARGGRLPGLAGGAGRGDRGEGNRVCAAALGAVGCLRRISPEKTDRDREAPSYGEGLRAT
jgi:tellurite resistance protein TerC